MPLAFRHEYLITVNSCLREGCEAEKLPNSIVNQQIVENTTDDTAYPCRQAASIKSESAEHLVQGVSLDT